MLMTYAQRLAYCRNPTAIALLQLIEKKQSNLCVSADFTDKEALLRTAELLGPEICVLKTHIDVVEDFDEVFVAELTRLARLHQFLIFEDRKFADIGNTVKLQYAKGVYRIADWAQITNCHTIAGPGSIEGLASVGLAKGNGLLLLAEMSPKGNLIDPDYTQATVQMAATHSDFVIGFIAMQRLTDNPALIHFTPGIHIAAKGDALGQQYTSPEQAILEKDVDVIIVGRGIYEAADPKAAAEEYRASGWEAYLRKIQEAN